MESERSRRIRDSMRDIFNRYSSLKLGKSDPAHTENSASDADKPEFWDVVVLTTFDSAQQLSFQRQIDFKKQHGQLPEVPIYVVADPPDQKLGVGGSTLHVLSELYKEFGEALYWKKLLVIHSGGSSQRLPSYSVLGKIFAPVPARGLSTSVDSSVPQMLDLKLAMYLPFCQLLGPGVFVTCADDIETYCLDTKSLDVESLRNAAVVALSHPSKVQTGEGHGVYVVDNHVTHSSNWVNKVQECLEVLQKPSEKDMRARGAVYIQEEGDSPKEQVWSDSVFWLSERVCRDLLRWYIRNSPISSELDAYAHFLPCLGKRMANAKPADFQDYRSEMLPLLKDSCFKVLMLNESEFYHLGTMKEYLVHFNILKSFCTELGIMKNTSNLDSPCVRKGREQLAPSVCETGIIIETYFSEPSIRITLFQDSTQFVIENSRIETSFGIRGDVIISSCVIKKTSGVSFLSHELSLFGDLLYHTVPVNYEGKPLYVTVAFDLAANMKCASESLAGISNYGYSLREVVDILGYQVAEVVPKASDKVSLWNTRMFRAGLTPAESFWLTHNAINKVKHTQVGEPLQTFINESGSSLLFSMSDVVKYKDLDTLLKDRSNLLSCMHR